MPEQHCWAIAPHFRKAEPVLCSKKIMNTGTLTSGQVFWLSIPHTLQCQIEGRREGAMFSANQVQQLFFQHVSPEPFWGTWLPTSRGWNFMLFFIPPNNGLLIKHSYSLCFKPRYSIISFTWDPWNLSWE